MGRELGSARARYGPRMSLARSNQGGPCPPCSTLSGRAGPELEALQVNPLAGEAPDALLRQLGPAPVEVGDVNLTELLVGVYARLAQAAEQRALRE